MMKKILLACTILLASINYSSAQDSAFDDLTMNGISIFEKLRKDYYIGALFLESLDQDAGNITNMPGKKRIEMRILVDKWSSRRFAKEWKNAILLSNDPSSLENLTTQIQSFTNIPQDDLIEGDRITIDMQPDLHTTIYLNNQRVFRTSNNDFFYALLNTWIGSKPPSSDFKNDILSLPTGEKGNAFLIRYEGLNYSDKRKKQVAAWSKKSTTNSAPASAAPVTASSSFAPPGATTSARASFNTKNIPAPTKNKAAVAKKTAEQKRNAELLAQAQAEKAIAEAKAAKAAEALRKAQEEKAREEALDSYRSEMYQVIAQKIKYPKRSQERGERGRVVIKATIDRSGNILKLEQESSSKYSRLNNAAEKAVKSAAPFNPISETIIGEEFEFTFPFNF